MTLEEAIRHAEEKAKCDGKCGEDHAQLAEWLKELKMLQSAQPKIEERKEELEHFVPKEGLISRKAAIDAVNGVIADYIPTLYGRYEALPLEMAKAIIRLPTAQPEIIRCGDCKHWMPYDWMFSEVWRSKDIDDYSEDEIGCAYCDMNMGANDFCSRGERRTDENNNE